MKNKILLLIFMSLFICQKLSGQLTGPAIEIDSVANKGIFIKHTVAHAIDIESTDQDGIHVGNAGDEGLHIDSSGDFGIGIFKTGGDGINIGQTNGTGINITQAGEPSALEFPNLFKNGFNIIGTEDHGLFVGRADDNGVHIKSSGQDGLHIERAERFGLRASGSQAAAFLDGKVGINTETPQFPFVIQKTENALTNNLVDISNLALVLEKRSNVSQEGIGLGFQSSGDQDNIGAAIVHERTGSASKGKLHFATKVSSGQESDLPIHMTIDEHGDVGVGTQTPEAPLHIGGGSSSKILLDNAGDLMWKNSSDQHIAVLTLHADNHVYLDASADPSSRLIFRTGTSLSERIRITENGNVGIGTTTPESRLQVNGDVNTTGEVHQVSTNDAHMLPICYGFVSGDGTIVTGSGNFSCVRTAPGIYEITITDHFFQPDENIVVVTPYAALIGANATYASNSTTGTLIVLTSSGAPGVADSAFSFIVYSP